MIIYFVFLVLLLVVGRAAILMLIQYLSAWGHAETHSFIHSILDDHLFCAKHYARFWGYHDEQSEHCPCLHGILSLDAQYVPLSLGLVIACLLHPYHLSLSSCCLSLPWVPAAGLPSLPPSNPHPSLHRADSSRRTPPLKTSLSTCHILPCSTCSKSFNDSPFPVKWDPNSFTIWPESSNSASPSCPIPLPSLISYLFLCSREGLLTVPIHCCLIPRPHCTSISDKPIHPSEVPRPAGCLP